MLDPRLLQLCDSAFPSGAFSQSFGIETAVAEARVHDAETAAAWIATYLHGSAATFDAPAIVLAMERRVDVDLLDETLTASVFAGDVRAATRRLARSTLGAYRAMGLDDAAIAAYRGAIDAHRAHGHHALACALGYRAIGAAGEDAVCAHLSAAVAALAAAASRAVPLGQRDVAALLWRLRPAIAAAARAAAAARGLDDLATWAADCEIDALRHERLDARMFAS